MATAQPSREDQQGPTARRIVLGTQLRRLREQAEVSRAEAGYHIRGSESKISRLELGRVSFKVRDVIDLLALYKETDPVVVELFRDMAEKASEQGWWHRYTDLMPAWFQDYVGLEESAARIQTFELQFVPGLLQTEDYARAIATHGRPKSQRDEVERRVALRMRRQKVLLGPNPPRLWAVVDESVLHRPIGGRQAMIKQIDRLLEATKQPNVTLQLLPFLRSGFAAEGGFTLLRFAEPELPDLVYLEHLSGAFYLDKLDEIETYSRAIDRLTVDAQTPEHTRQSLTKLRAEY